MNRELAFQVLKFREELVKLMDKYNVEISGSTFDDGSIDIQIKNEDATLSEQFYITDNSDLINPYKLYFEEDGNFWKNNNECKYPKVFSKSVKEYLIKEMFRNNVDPMNGVFSSKKDNRVYFLTDNGKKFREFRESKNIIAERNSINESWFDADDGKKYILLHPFTNSRGIKIRHLIIDRNFDITNEIFLDVILPCCVYMSKDDVEIY